MSANRSSSHWRGVHRVLCWTCMIGTILLFCFWFASRWFYAGETVSTQLSLHLGAGQFKASSMVSGPAWSTYWLGRYDKPQWEWGYFYKSWYGDFTLSFPLWWPICVLAAVWLMLRCLPRFIRQLIRAPEGACPNCSYDLRGLQPGERCPECGRTP